jgi:uncharacterized protein (DUF1697 family)
VTYIALLRAVNLAGLNRVSMGDLRAWLLDLGFANPQTLLQSGNAVFQGRDRSAAAIEALLERDAKKRLKIDTTFFVRTADEWSKVAARNPFPKEAERDPGHLLVVFLKESAAAKNVTALEQAIVGREIVRADARQLYVVFPDGVGRSRLTTALIEKKIGSAGTGRNWNTVLKLKELACLPQPGR